MTRAEPIVVECECEACSGTGLYKSFAEHDGAAVICQTCHGEGKSKITYRPFQGRKRREDVTRVYLTAGGYGITSKDIVVDGKMVRFSEAGCSYEAWLNGAKPEPIKDLHCPYQHTSQWLQNSDHPANELYKGKCKDLLTLGLISDCPGMKTKHECWYIYDRLTNKKEPC